MDSMDAMDAVDTKNRHHQRHRRGPLKKRIMRMRQEEQEDEQKPEQVHDSEVHGNADVDMLERSKMAPSPTSITSICSWDGSSERPSSALPETSSSSPNDDHQENTIPSSDRLPQSNQDASKDAHTIHANSRSDSHSDGDDDDSKHGNIPATPSCPTTLSSMPQPKRKQRKPTSRDGSAANLSRAPSAKWLRTKQTKTSKKISVSVAKAGRSKSFGLRKTSFARQRAIVYLTAKTHVKRLVSALQRKWKIPMIKPLPRSAVLYGDVEALCDAPKLHEANPSGEASTSGDDAEPSNALIRHHARPWMSNHPKKSLDGATQLCRPQQLGKPLAHPLPIHSLRRLQRQIQTKQKKKNRNTQAWQGVRSRNGGSHALGMDGDAQMLEPSTRQHATMATQPTVQSHCPLLTFKFGDPTLKHQYRLHGSNATAQTVQRPASGGETSSIVFQPRRFEHGVPDDLVGGIHANLFRTRAQSSGAEHPKKALRRASLPALRSDALSANPAHTIQAVRRFRNSYTHSSSNRNGLASTGHEDLQVSPINSIQEPARESSNEHDADNGINNEGNDENVPDNNQTIPKPRQSASSSQLPSMGFTPLKPQGNRFGMPRPATPSTPTQQHDRALRPIELRGQGLFKPTSHLLRASAMAFPVPAAAAGADMPNVRPAHRWALPPRSLVCSDSAKMSLPVPRRQAKIGRAFDGQSLGIRSQMTKRPSDSQLISAGRPNILSTIDTIGHDEYYEQIYRNPSAIRRRAGVRQERIVIRGQVISSMEVESNANAPIRNMHVPAVPRRSMAPTGAMIPHVKPMVFQPPIHQAWMPQTARQEAGLVMADQPQAGPTPTSRATSRERGAADTPLPSSSSCTISVTTMSARQKPSPMPLLSVTSSVINMAESVSAMDVDDDVSTEAPLCTSSSMPFQGKENSSHDGVGCEVQWIATRKPSAVPNANSKDNANNNSANGVRVAKNHAKKGEAPHIIVID